MSDQGHKGFNGNNGLLELPAADTGGYASTDLVSVASIRDRVRHLSPERRSEIFTDFAKAIESQNLGYLADTIANWALGGHGYDYAGTVVNTRLATLPPLSDDSELQAAWEEYKAEQHEAAE